MNTTLRFLAASALTVVLLPLSTPLHAATADAGKDDAVAMVKKGLAYLKANGQEKTFAEINNRQGSFVDRDLYLVAYTLEGKCVAHGANPKQVGRDLIDLTDIDGKLFIKERVAMVKSKPNGAWQQYKFTNPVSKKIEPKVMYCEKAGDLAICGGVYE